MSDRYKPKDLLRERGTGPAKPQSTPIDIHQQQFRLAKKIGSTPVDCVHGVPWVNCTLCSKPKAKDK